jgi:Tfp pilus assembly major pilin PilA
LEFKEREEKRLHRQLKEMHRMKKAMNATDITKSATIEQLSSDEDDANKSSTVSENKDVTDEEMQISKYHQDNTLKNKYSIQTTPSTSHSNQTPKQCRLIDDPLFVASLDRTKTTPREAMHIVAPALKAVGIDIDEVTISTSSIYIGHGKQ